MARIKHNIQTMHALAVEKGVKFLSDDYYGMHIHHLWECSSGHQWTSQPANIKYIPFGKCPICSKKGESNN